MTRESFLNLKVGDKVRRARSPEMVFTVVNNDPPGMVILIPGRVTMIATRPVHPEIWEMAPNQHDEPA